MRLSPFIFVIYKIPIRTAVGTIRVGIGLLIRMGKTGWVAVPIFVLAAIFTLGLIKGRIV